MLMMLPQPLVRMQGYAQLSPTAAKPLRAPISSRACRTIDSWPLYGRREGSRIVSTLATSDGSTLADGTQPGTPAGTAAGEPAVTSSSSSSSNNTTASTASSSSSNASGTSLLTSAEPIDRLRYQAVLVFQQFDTQQAGELSAEQVQQFLTSSARKVSWSPGLSDVLQQVEDRFAHLKQRGCSREEFIKLVRSQVHAVSTSQPYQSSMLRPDVTARLQAQMSINVQELAAAKWMFGLLDFDNDGKVELSMYSKAEGIEAYVYEDKVEDADADDDGFITFEEFLVSYARPKPILKNLLIMAINTAVIYLILQTPLLDVMLKVVLVGVLMLRPQLVSRPAALLHDAIKAIIDQGRAQAEVAKSNRGVWRPT